MGNYLSSENQNYKQVGQSQSFSSQVQFKFHLTWRIFTGHCYDNQFINLIKQKQQKNPNFLCFYLLKLADLLIFSVYHHEYNIFGFFGQKKKSEDVNN